MGSTNLVVGVTNERSLVHLKYSTREIRLIPLSLHFNC